MRPESNTRSTRMFVGGPRPAADKADALVRGYFRDVAHGGLWCVERPAHGRRFSRAVPVDPAAVAGDPAAVDFATAEDAAKWNTADFVPVCPCERRLLAEGRERRARLAGRSKPVERRVNAVREEA